jgi:hypothetical protein
VGHGFGDVTVGPVILQWPKHSLFRMPIHQRALLDIDAPVARYSRYASVNIGINAWDIHPYYAITLFPVKKLETSLRIHYLWNGTNAEPSISQSYCSTQARQAIHFNATASYEIVKNVYGARTDTIRSSSRMHALAAYHCRILSNRLVRLGRDS